MPLLHTKSIAAIQVSGALIEFIAAKILAPASAPLLLSLPIGCLASR